MVGADMQNWMDANSIGRTTERQHYRPNGGLALSTIAPRRMPRPVLGEATASDKANRKSTFSPVSIYGLISQHSRRTSLLLFSSVHPYTNTLGSFYLLRKDIEGFQNFALVYLKTALLSVILVECLNPVVQLIRQYGR